jgi:membrane-associated phospholipid phosphatase
MTAAADFIARHALLVLFSAAALASIAAAVLWKLIERFAPKIWKLVVALWDHARVAPIARRLRSARVVGPALGGALTLTRYLGIIAVLGFAAAAGAIVLFVEVADEVGANESFAAFDIVLSTALREHAPYEVLRFLAAITHLGDFEFLATLVLAVFAILLALRRRALAAAWLIAAASGGFLNRVLKAVFERTRPLHDHELTIASGWSFPSGHASGAMLVYGLLAYVLVRHTRPAWHAPIAVAAVLLIIFVGASRVMLQVHYLTDVIAGYLASAAWLAIWISALEAVRWRGARAAVGASPVP